MRFTSLALLALMLVACGGDDPQGPTPPSIFGTYAVETIDGEPLPYTSVDLPDLTVEVLNASYRLNSDMTWSLEAALRETRLGEVTTETTTETGTFVQNGDALELTDSDGEVYSGTLSGEILTVIFAGLSWVAVK